MIFSSTDVLFYDLLSASLLSLGNTQVNLVLLSLNRKLLFPLALSFLVSQ